MGIVQRIEESKAAAKQAKQKEDQTALIAALEAELAEENAGEEEPQDPIVIPVIDDLQEPETAPTETEATPKSKGKKA